VKLYLIYKDECLFVCTYVWNLYKFTFLNRSESDFAHVSPSIWKRPYGMYIPQILDLFDLLGPFSLWTTAESWAQDGCRRDRFPRCPYIRDCSWCACDVADCGVIRGSLISVILAGVPLTSRKWRRSRGHCHPPQRRIPYSGGCSRHVTDITFNRATEPSATALYPSF